MVPHLNQSNDYFKRKLQVWTAQKCIALVGAERVHTSAGPQTTPFHGGQSWARNGNMQNIGPTNPHGTHLLQCNGYIKRKLRAWRGQKFIALVAAETVLTSAGPQTYLFHGGQYTFWNRKMRNFGGTYRHGTAFPQEECSYQKEATGTENPKICCSSLWTNDTYLCGSANYPVSWVVV